MARWMILPLLAVFGIAPSVAAQTVYDVSQGSFYGTGCFSPDGNGCPTSQSFDLNGTFVLTLVDTLGELEVYSVDDVDWQTSDLDGDVSISGIGVYQVDTAAGLHSIFLQLDVDGVSQDFESVGFVDAQEFPDALEIAAAIDTGVGQFDVISLVGFPEPGPAASSFRRGDANGDGSVNGIIDAIFLLNYQFVPGSSAPPCDDSADVDDDGVLNGLSDALYLLLWNYAGGGNAPPPPGPADCGSDPTSDSLICISHPCP